MCLRSLFLSIFLLVPSLLSTIQAQDLHVSSFNIRYDNPKDGLDRWDLRKKDLCTYIGYQSPAILGLQEVTHSQLQHLLTALKEYDYVGVGRDDGHTAGEYSPILYKRNRFELRQSGTFWLSEKPDQVSIGWDAALPRICTYALLFDKKHQKPIWVFNTHFDHIGTEARRRSAQLIIQRLSDQSLNQDALILMGDFNAESEDPPLQDLLNYFEDPWISAPSKIGPESTFNGFKLMVNNGKRLDYVFHKNLSLVKYRHSDSRRPNGRQLSDHMAVEAFYDFK